MIHFAGTLAEPLRRQVANRPGLVKTVSGSWTEVRGDREKEYAATTQKALAEDENTIHWVYNDGNEPAVGIVCGLARAK